MDKYYDVNHALIVEWTFSKADNPLDPPLISNVRYADLKAIMCNNCCRRSLLAKTSLSAMDRSTSEYRKT